MIFTLIGMPGSGKSCLGRAISGKLKMRSIDSDKVIERIHGKKLHQIIEEVGLEGFKKVEEEALMSINDDKLILSTGGSAVYYPRAMEHLRSKGKIIYLRVGIPELKRRLGDFSKRGIVMREGQTIEDLYAERCALYEKYADIIIDCDGNAYPRYQAEAIKAIQNAIRNP